MTIVSDPFPPVNNRDVTKFDWQHSNFKRFQQIQNSTNVLSASECEVVEKFLLYDWFHMHREPESSDKPVFFSQIQPIIQTTVIERVTIFAQWCVTLY